MFAGYMGWGPIKVTTVNLEMRGRLGYHVDWGTILIVMKELSVHFHGVILESSCSSVL